MYLNTPFTYNVSPRFIDFHHFAVLSIDWGSRSLTVNYIDSAGRVRFSHTISFAEMRTKSTKQAYCFQEPQSRKTKHILGAYTVIVLPIVLHLLALLIYLRKHSNSY